LGQVVGRLRRVAGPQHPHAALLRCSVAVLLLALCAPTVAVGIAQSIVALTRRMPEYLGSLGYADVPYFALKQVTGSDLRAWLLSFGVPVLGCGAGVLLLRWRGPRWLRVQLGVFG
jgi:hypothetical protein